MLLKLRDLGFALKAFVVDRQWIKIAHHA